ncbi:tyrosine-protein kinase Shark isoform X2 [Lutzomyia longipalpis]|uniref:Tyrosine-protein kinase n=2 Tax=Lutzomyia longipalpis TaxID=7200 RepID=A0A7G3AUV5_LUTLO|nr:tyrosine-protein kinase Shark isoform X2 [Lutzomyia longipalpis]
MNREDNLCWFHGRVSRERAEQILRDEGYGDGVFLVRESNSSSGDYVLSVLHEGQVCHYQIRRHGEDAFFSIDDNKRIHGLDSLIEHYQQSSHGLVTKLSAIVKCDPPPHDSRCHGRMNLLHRATKEGNYTVVSELLKCGYRNIDAKNQDGQTAVHLACQYADEAILQKIIECDANINFRDIKGNTPLHYACRTQPASMIKLLIDAKANIQARNNETGCVPLHDAAEHGNLDAIKVLLAAHAPLRPRSSSGELPIDLAQEKGHTHVVEFLKNYKEPTPTTFSYQWYHGTLDRVEAVALIQEYARSLLQVKWAADKNQADGNGVDANANDESNQSDITDGVYLLRYTAKNKGSQVLTLLFDNQPMHFMIQKTTHFLYIDEGPYMTSLEHLVQHYTKFDDGLPVNLRHPVRPKPKPPLPLTSTMPKVKRPKAQLSSSLSSPEQANDDSPKSVRSFVRNRSDSEGMEGGFTILKTRNLSVPSNDFINKAGLLGTSPTSPESNSPQQRKGSKSPDFRSLKQARPKKNIFMEGLNSLRRSRKGGAKKEEEQKSVDQQLEIDTNLMKNLSFSTDFLVQSPTTDTVYNTPTNNCAIVDIDIERDHCPRSQETDDARNSNVSAADSQAQFDSIDYFTESDVATMENQMKDKDTEEIYFIDKPIVDNRPESRPIQGNNGNLVNEAGYIVMQKIPMFMDMPANANYVPPNPPKFDRIDSVVSERSESEFAAILQHQISTVSTSSNTTEGSSQKTTKPYYFIPACELKLDTVLGEGEFGSVYRGSLSPSEESEERIPVAIKTLHDERCRKNREEFLREANVMIQLRHHCIVKLIGISKGPPLMMVQELVSLGSMLDYLHQHGDTINPNCELRLWASQIACGMNYLEKQHYVHRDLAARNILLASKNQAKISDFGLSRALAMDNDYYKASQGGKWPIKWYAQESFNYGTFSHASDVWSFGITLWEMYTLGEPPYGDMKGVDVIKLIEEGKRLLKPTLCPDDIFERMENCWNYNPKDRPTFRHLTEFFAPDYANLTELIKSEQIV